MKTKLIIPALLVLLTACSDDTITSDQLSKNAIPVDVSKIERGTFKSSVELVGKLVPSRQEVVTSKTALPIAKIHVHNGDDVEKGTVLFTLENSQLKQQLSQATSIVNTLENTKIELQGIVGQQQAAQAQIKSIINSSIEQVQKAEIPEQQELKKDVIGALEELQTLSPQGTPTTSSALNLVNQQLQQARAGVNQASKAIQATTITAPISGTISEINVTEGMPALPSQPLAIVSGKNNVKAVFSANKHQVALLKEKMNSIVSTGESNQTYNGTIQSISNEVNKQTNTYTVTVPLGKTNDRIKSGELATGTFMTYSNKNALILPVESLLFDDGKTYVFIAKNHQAIKTRITIKKEQKDVVQVDSGLKEGDLVITNGKYQLTNGSKISFKK
ncbi:efflux RND transporter periplasmic adaptor subunit [Pseudalkalibacillus decolorationis]|uniref:efflux RND transporter periplasmic adaptor subunit n=1 Tax=Pseudalkalibacillus decolorationis TaxID=163879 RepID=UPI0021494CA9|nr:efflux RND transporter periplasmic adaptor subunit [Pseudalkalibacillus decolorationis]